MSRLNRGIVYNVYKVYAALFIIISVFVVDIVFKQHIESSKREQARYNIEHSIECLKDCELLGKEIGYKTFKHCMYKQRTSTTGYMYVLDISTLEFVYDGSTDVPKDTTLYFTEESVGKYFKDWASAFNALLLITSGTESTTTNAWYNFDGSKEWLEYKTYRTNSNDYYIVVQGIQEDEVLDNFFYFRIITVGLVSIYVIWLLASSLQARRKEDECR